MPLGIITDDELKSELVHLGIVTEESKKKAEIVDIKRGRGDKEETPEVIRNIVAECALQGAPHKQLIEMFGVSQASVSAYKNGATSTATYHEGEKKLKNHTNQVRARISKKATNRMMAALDGITKEKLEDVKPRDLAAIAKDMSAVIKNIEPQKESNENDGVRFVIYAPQLKQEIDFQTIHVSE